jgi:chondroitin AC lyase
LFDLHFWATHFHRVAHQFQQSGFHPDGTVSHHLPGSSDIAMYAYGYGWLTEVIDAYQLLRDAPLDLGSHGYQFIADRLLYTYDKMIYNGGMDFTVCGRSYSGSMTKFVATITEDIDHLLAAKQPSTVITNEKALRAWRAALANNTQASSGNYPFWVGQYLVHRRGTNGEPPFFFSVKMKNDRTNGAEDFDPVKKSYHCGSGILQAKVVGDEYEDTRAGWDWHALPGLTEEWRTDALEQGIAYGASPFAGMASDGRFGFAAMEYRAHPKEYASAQADKAFFFTEAEAIALGCNVARVNGGQGKEIITTIDQTRWAGDVTYSLKDGGPVVIKQGESVDFTLNLTQPSWVHQGRIGYVIIPQGTQPLHIRGGKAVLATEAGTRTRRRQRESRKVSPNADAAPQTIIHFALGHGINPATSGLTKYCYLIAVNKSASDMPAYMKEALGRISILANEKGAQGIADQRTKLVQIAFKKAGEIQPPNGARVAVDRPALVQWRQNDKHWSFCATNPLHDGAKELNIELNLPLLPGNYKYQLGGIYPRPGGVVIVSPSQKATRLTIQLPDMSHDAEYNYQAALYAGVPIHLDLPSQ